MAKVKGQEGKTKVMTCPPNLESPSDPSPELTVEDVLEELGGFSWIQLFLTIVIISPEIPGSMISLSPILTGSSNVPFGCRTSDGFRSMTKDDICTLTNCTSSPIPLTSQSIVQEWGLICERGWIVDTLTSIQMGGGMAGALISAELSDRWGRRTVFLSLCFLMGTFGIAGGWAWSIVVFGATKLITGFAIGGMYVVYLNYLMEFLTPSYRTICGCVSMWSVGEILLGLLGYIFPDWRELTWATAVPALIVLLSFPWLPESPRWLLCQGQTVKAIKVFNQIARWNGRSPVDPTKIHKLQDGITGALDPQKKLGDGEKRAIDDLDPSTNPSSQFIIFRKKQYMSQLCIFIWVWFVNGIVYYGLSFNTKHLTGDPNLNVIYLGLTGLPGCFPGLYFNNRFGRKKTFFGFLFFGSICLTSLVLVEEFDLDNGTPFLMTTLSFLGRFFISGSWGILACFTAESFPTVSRGTCMGISALSGYIGGILAPQLVYFGTVWSIGPYLVFCILTSVSAIASLRLKETTGKPLEDCDKGGNK